MRLRAGWQKRLQGEVYLTGGLALLGIGYFLVVSILGVGLPCIFRLFTGLKCPGCGITHLVFAVLAGDWQAAWQANQLLFVLLPFLAVFIFSEKVCYVMTGERREIPSPLLWLMVIMLLAFGVWRNIAGC